jgi:hypothetical protein
MASAGKNNFACAGTGDRIYDRDPPARDVGSNLSIFGYEAGVATGWSRVTGRSRRYRSMMLARRVEILSIFDLGKYLRKIIRKTNKSFIDDFYAVFVELSLYSLETPAEASSVDNYSVVGVI